MVMLLFPSVAAPNAGALRARSDKRRRKRALLAPVDPPFATDSAADIGLFGTNCKVKGQRGDVNYIPSHAGNR
jgi:hypothetical protein